MVNQYAIGDVSFAYLLLIYDSHSFGNTTLIIWLVHSFTQLVFIKVSNPKLLITFTDLLIDVNQALLDEFRNG